MYVRCHKKSDFVAQNNKFTDQHAHHRSLTSIFVIRFLESILAITRKLQMFSILARLCSLTDWFDYYLRQVLTRQDSYVLTLQGRRQLWPFGIFRETCQKTMRLSQ